MDRDTKILVIPRHMVFVRFIDIPSLEESEIKKMVEFQAIKEIPYPKEEMLTSYRNISSSKEGFSTIMMAVAKKGVIQKMMKECGQRLKAVRLRSELLYLYLLKKNVLSAERVDLVIHIGKEDSEIMIVDRTRPIFSRGFKNSERFLEEIRHSVLAYQRNKNNPAIDSIVVTHVSNIDIEYAKPYLQKQFTMPVNFYEYSEKLARIDLPAQINLLPKEISEEKVRLSRKREILMTGVLAGFIVLLFFSFFSFKLYKKRSLFSALSSKVDQIQSNVDQLEDLGKKTEIAKRHIRAGKFIISVLNDSYKIRPTDLSITGLSFDGEKSIVYKGHSKDMSAIFSFVKKLERTNYFGKVEVKYATKKKVKGEEITDFNIQCEIDMDYNI